MIFWIVLAFVLVLMAGFVAGCQYQKSKLPEDYRIFVMKEHAKLLRKARWAMLTRREGLANIYSEAADRVLDMVQPPKELGT